MTEPNLLQHVAQKPALRTEVMRTVPLASELEHYRRILERIFWLDRTNPLTTKIWAHHSYRCGDTQKCTK